MAKRLVLFDKATGKIRGYIFVSQDEDAARNQGGPDDVALELSPDHPARYEQADWHVQDGQLVSKKTGQVWTPKKK